MTKLIRNIFLILLIIFISQKSFSQKSNIDFNQNPFRTFDSLPQVDYKNISISGLFISPLLGLEFPVKNFTNTSKSGLTYGVNFKYANFKLFPFIFGVLYQYQQNKGNDDFLTLNLLNNLDTKIHSFGVSMDIILNKYLKSNFTIPFLTFEFKYLKVQRVISPENNTLNILTSDNLFGLTAGLGFTLQIFDIYGTYTYAKDFSSAAIKTRFHFPLIKF